MIEEQQQRKKRYIILSKSGQINGPDHIYYEVTYQSYANNASR